MNIRRWQLWTLSGAALLSGLLHVWISSVTVWEIIHSNFQFLVWPGLAALALMQSLMPETIGVQYDPLPPPYIMWAALAVNILVWTGLFWGVLAGLKIWLAKSRT